MQGLKRLRHIMNHVSSKEQVRRCSAVGVSNPESGVRIEKVNNNYLITLSRPKALNALNASMIEELTPFYKSVLKQNNPSIIIMRGEGGKAFCAGGDVRSLYDMKQEGRSVEDLLEFFKIEYELNQIIGTLPNHIQQVSLLNGITMGGGVGLSVHGSYRVAMENTMFAMPETALGFFCDVGGSYFLPRLPLPGVGMWLALSGARLKGADIYHTGIATHYTNLEKLEELQSHLLSLEDPRSIPALLQDFLIASNVQPWAQPSDLIERHFTLSNVEDIVKSCEETEWGQAQLKLLSRMSPTALKVVHRQLVEGARLNFANCFRMEIDMAREFMAGSEFFEGVRSVLVDKDRNPQWSPSTLANVENEAVDQYFTNVKKYLKDQAPI